MNTVLVRSNASRTVLLRGGTPGPAGPTGPAGPGTGRLGTVAETITDWNAANSNGWYNGNNALNAPTTDWVYGQTTMFSTTYGVQTVRGLFGSGEYDARIYERTLDNGTWGAWRKVLNEQPRFVTAATSGGTANLVAGEEFGFGSMIRNHGGFYLGTSISSTGRANSLRIHVPVAGSYWICGKAYRPANAAPARLNVLKNGTFVSFIKFGTAPADAVTQAIPPTSVPMLANDYFSMEVDSATDLFLSPGHTELYIKYLGE